MAWTLTDSLDEFTAHAAEHLRADPVRHTVPLTVMAALQGAGPSAFGDETPVYGWHEAGHGAVEGAAADAAETAGRVSSAGPVDGAFLQTPPFPVLVATLPAGGAPAFIATLVGARSLPEAVNLPGPQEAAFVAAWADITGGSASVGLRSRLFRLGDLVSPDPMPAGAARVATEADRDLLVDWLTAFHAEATRMPPERVARTVDERLSDGRFTLWEAGGQPVSLAGRTREIAGVARVATVYTPPEHRRRSYGGAVTTACTQAALDDGAQDVVLFTDQANPTSNALYQRLGYRPVEDRVVLDLRPGSADQPDVTTAGGASSERS